MIVWLCVSQQNNSGMVGSVLQCPYQKRRGARLMDRRAFLFEVPRSSRTPLTIIGTACVQ